VQVIGVLDSRYGEEICAWIDLKGGQSATPRGNVKRTKAALQAAKARARKLGSPVAARRWRRPGPPDRPMPRNRTQQP
jgi:acyl-CoA synthetase (AMP-forming)/AMP-acid ligase II